jgi:hypothetical protein
MGYDDTPKYVNNTACMFVSDILDAVYDTTLEQQRPEWMNSENRWNAAIEETVEYFRKHKTFLEVGQQNKYSKRIVL